MTHECDVSNLAENHVAGMASCGSFETLMHLVENIPFL
jgi:hypothetical protein